MTYHYALRTILLDDVLTFLDRLAEAIGEPRLRECLAGKNAKLFIESCVASCRLLAGVKTKNVSQENKENGEPIHQTLGRSRLFSIISQLPEELDLDLFQRLIGTESFQDDIGVLVNLSTAVDLSMLDAEEMQALKQITKSRFTLAELAKAVKESPDELSDLVEGVDDYGLMTVADLVKVL